MKKFLLAFAVFFSLLNAKDEICLHPDSYYRYLDKYLLKLHKEFADQACEKYELKCPAEKRIVDDKIEFIGAQFLTKKNLTTDESRLLVLQLLNDYSKMINENKNLKNYLITRPFEINRIDIRLNIENESVPADIYDYIIFNQGKIYYCFSKNDSPSDGTEKEETLEEACRKANFSFDSSGNKISENSAQSPEEFFTEANRQSKIFSERMQKKICEKYGLQYNGCQHEINDKIEHLNFYFMILEQKKLEDLTFLITKITKDLTDEINDDQEIEKYLSEIPFPGTKINIYITMPKNFIDGESKKITHIYKELNEVKFIMDDLKSPYVKTPKFHVSLEKLIHLTGIEIMPLNIPELDTRSVWDESLVVNYFFPTKGIDKSITEKFCEKFDLDYMETFKKEEQNRFFSYGLAFMLKKDLPYEQIRSILVQLFKALYEEVNSVKWLNLVSQIPFPAEKLGIILKIGPYENEKISYYYLIRDNKIYKYRLSRITPLTTKKCIETLEEACKKENAEVPVLHSLFQEEFAEKLTQPLKK